MASSKNLKKSQESESDPATLIEQAKSSLGWLSSMIFISVCKLRVITSNIYLSYKSNNVDLRSFSSIVDWLAQSVKFCDLGGQEIYYMFVGGIIFIVLSHLFSFLMNNIVYKFIVSFQFLNQIIVFLAQCTLFVVFAWFILAFVAFLYVLFGKENAWIQTQRDRIKHGLNPLNGSRLSTSQNNDGNKKSN